ncbi:MAG: LysR family transcriptional regulator [Desulfovibrionales bacterium]|nr:LysR family transcriptional regulator [Desulfovibrionales bacterium]
MNINFKIWLEEDGEVLFGKGREELLEAIEEFRTLIGAAKKLNMSYRAAWGRLRASEERLGFKLVEQDLSRKVMSLTEEARKLLQAYKALRRETQSFLEEASPRLLPEVLLSRTVKKTGRKGSRCKRSGQ